MLHLFTIELSDVEVEAFLETYNYQPMIANPDLAERRRRPEVQNPIPPEQFVQGIIEGSIEKVTETYVGQKAARDAHQAAIAAHRTAHPRRRDRR